MISDKASKLQLIEAFSSLTLPDIVEGKFPTIGALQTIHGKEVIDMAMAVIIADLNQSFSGDLTKDDIMECAVEIRSGITRNISLEGLYMVCSQLKRSSTFKLKIPNILKAVNDHFEQQSAAIQQRNLNLHLAQQYNAPRTSEQYAESDNAFQQFQAEYFKSQNSQKP